MSMVPAQPVSRLGAFGQRASHEAGRWAGLFTGLVRDVFSGERNRAQRLDGEDIERRPLTEEKVRAGPAGVLVPWFLPWFADDTGETPGMRRWYRRMLADPNVKAAFLGKVLAVCAQELQIHPRKKDDERDKGIAEFFRWMIEERLSGGVVELTWSILSGAMLDGYSVCEKVTNVEVDEPDYHGKYVLDALKPKDTGNDLVLETDEFLNVRAVRTLRFNAGAELDPRDFVIYAHLPFWSHPTGTSDFRAAYGRFWMLDTVLKLRGMGLERRALPTLKGTWVTPSQKPSLEAALALARSSTWISIPDGVKVDALDIAGRADDMFASAVRDLKEDIFLAIAGATLQALTGGPGQQRGNSQVHKDTADLLKWYLAQAVCSVLNHRKTGIIPYYCALNFQGARPPKATLSAIDDGELAEAMQVDTGLAQIGFPLSLEGLAERYGRELPASDRDTLRPPQQPAAGGAQPFTATTDRVSVTTVPVKKRFGERGGKTCVLSVADYVAERRRALTAKYGKGVAAAVIRASADALAG